MSVITIASSATLSSGGSSQLFDGSLVDGARYRITMSTSGSTVYIGGSALSGGGTNGYPLQANQVYTFDLYYQQDLGQVINATTSSGSPILNWLAVPLP